MSLPWLYVEERRRWECGDRFIGPYFEIHRSSVRSGNSVFVIVKVFYDGLVNHYRMGFYMYNYDHFEVGFSTVLACEEASVLDCVEKIIADRCPEVYFRLLLGDSTSVTTQ